MKFRYVVLAHVYAPKRPIKSHSGVFRGAKCWSLPLLSYKLCTKYNDSGLTVNAVSTNMKYL